MRTVFVRMILCSYDFTCEWLYVRMILLVNWLYGCGHLTYAYIGRVLTKLLYHFVMTSAKSAFKAVFKHFVYLNCRCRWRTKQDCRKTWTLLCILYRPFRRDFDSQGNNGSVSFYMFCEKSICEFEFFSLIQIWIWIK